MIRPAGYRLPDATHLGRVRLQVSDLDRSIRFYETVLGLRTLTRDGAVATLGDEAGERALIELHTRPGVTPAPIRATQGLYHFAILVPDRPSLGRFLAHLATFNARVGMADHLVSEALYLSDPDGLGIEVYVDRPRDTWRMNGQELAMATDPLDAEDVVAAGTGEAWTGMPAGTVIGHVHLHVGDLERGSAFFHGALGFDKTVWSYPGALFLSAGGYHHHLGTNTWSRGPNPSENQARLLSWDIVVPGDADVKKAAASLAAAGYHVDEESEAIRAVDPWGTALRVTSRS